MKKTKNWLYWTPRILTILFIIFISLFALDIFTMGYGILGTLIGLFMHLIPAFMLIIILIIAWKWEYVGGIIFIILGLVFTLFFRTYQHIMIFLTISGPVFLIGVLFLLSKLKFKKRKKIRTIKKKNVKRRK